MRTRKRCASMRRCSTRCDSMAVPSMPSSPYRNCTTAPVLLRTVPSYLLGTHVALTQRETETQLAQLHWSDKTNDKKKKKKKKKKPSRP